MKRFYTYIKSMEVKQAIYLLVVFGGIYYIFGFIFSILYTNLYILNNYYKFRKRNFMEGIYIKR